MQKYEMRRIAGAMIVGLGTCGMSLLAGVAFGDDTPAAGDQAAATPPAPPTLLPAMAGPLATNAKPNTYDAGPLGNVFVTGVVSGFGQMQSNANPGDRLQQLDVSNAQVFINKPTGFVQYFIQAGAYSLPDLGTPYLHAGKATNAFYEPLPQAYIKLAPNDSFSIMAGKLPTLIGAEYTFSFENMNVERGLLWNQEPAVSRGVQANYTAGPVALSASWNDGLYSDIYSWVSASATWTIDKADSLAFVGAGNTKRTSVATSATPAFQNNEQVLNVIYTRTDGPWILQPYVQYTHVPQVPSLGSYHDASTLGLALLANYSFDPKSNLNGLSLPFRVEYISSSGSIANGAPNLLYAPGSKAWSLTATPTYQNGIFFVRAELSYVGTKDSPPGWAFGPSGKDTSQSRAIVEIGMIF